MVLTSIQIQINFKKKYLIRKWTDNRRVFYRPESGLIKSKVVLIFSSHDDKTLA